MKGSHRETAREIANHHLAQGDSLGWFEELYAQAQGNASIIPWADLRPNPNLVACLDNAGIEGQGKSALKIGCGLGDDAEELARRGFDTTAFDISPTAIAWCQCRFPGSAVTYIVLDLFHAPREWQGRFDFVLESYTLQVLPADMRRKAIARISGFVAQGGKLLVITRGREPGDPEGNIPWPLTREEIEAFAHCDMKEISFEDYFDQEEPPVRRFRVVYERK
ncbi:MAG: class I SAM-dependent methyltransferase [Proteobacteria bacterium]|nr:class I SAM-dependent methyltransferase [Pseudomonadota bacterium]